MEKIIKYLEKIENGTFDNDTEKEPFLQLVLDNFFTKYSLNTSTKPKLEFIKLPDRVDARYLVNNTIQIDSETVIQSPDSVSNVLVSLFHELTHYTQATLDMPDKKLTSNELKDIATSHITLSTENVKQKEYLPLPFKDLISTLVSMEPDPNSFNDPIEYQNYLKDFKERICNEFKDFPSINTWLDKYYTHNIPKERLKIWTYYLQPYELNARQNSTKLTKDFILDIKHYCESNDVCLDSVIESVEKIINKHINGENLILESKELYDINNIYGKSKQEEEKISELAEKINVLKNIVIENEKQSKNSNTKNDLFIKQIYELKEDIIQFKHKSNITIGHIETNQKLNNTQKINKILEKLDEKSPNQSKITYSTLINLSESMLNHFYTNLQTDTNYELNISAIVKNNGSSKMDLYVNKLYNEFLDIYAEKYMENLSKSPKALNSRISKIQNFNNSNSENNEAEKIVNSKILKQLVYCDLDSKTKQELINKIFEDKLKNIDTHKFSEHDNYLTYFYINYCIDYDKFYKLVYTLSDKGRHEEVFNLLKLDNNFEIGYNFVFNIYRNSNEGLLDNMNREKLFSDRIESLEYILDDLFVNAEENKKEIYKYLTKLSNMRFERPNIKNVPSDIYAKKVLAILEPYASRYKNIGKHENDLNNPTV